MKIRRGPLGGCLCNITDIKVSELLVASFPILSIVKPMSPATKLDRFCPHPIVTKDKVMKVVSVKLFMMNPLVESGLNNRPFPFNLTLIISL